MEVRSYNQELAISNLLFKKLFSNIKIQREDKNGKNKEIVVNCQFGQRSRIYKSWQNAERRAQMKLPMIIINRTGYSRDTQRLNNLHNEIKYEILSTNRVYDYLTPVPITINYEVTILSKYPSDIDQIASNFMVFFNSSLYVSCIHPKYDDIKMNNQVIMEDSVSEEHPDEIDGGTDDFITSTFNFTFKTFLFGGIKQAKKLRQQVLSSYLSTYIKHTDIVIKPNEIDAFQEKYPNTEVTATIDTQVTEEVTSYVDSSELSDYVYDDFVPIIKSINVGFYPVPQISGFEERMIFVDSQYSDKLIPISGYISSTNYISSYEVYYDEEGHEQKRLTALTPSDLHYEQVNSTRESQPYVDRFMRWTIDEN